MKKLILMSLLAVLTLWAAPWEIVNTPAMFDNPGIIKLVAGETQGLVFNFIAPEEILARASETCAMQVEFEMPEGLEYICSSRGDEQVEVKGHKVTVKTKMSPVFMASSRDSLSEWKTWPVAVRAPEEFKGPDTVLNMKLQFDGKWVAEASWQLELLPHFEPAAPLKHFQITFFDNGYKHLSKAHPALCDFWSRAGFCGAFTTAWKGVSPEKFISFGYVHHDNFANPGVCPEFDWKGNPCGGCVDGWYLRHKSLDEVLPNITATLVQSTRECGAMWTGVNYEITAGIGYIPESIAEFLNETGISEKDFQTMREQLLEYGYDHFWEKADARSGEVYQAWNRYQSVLHSEYFRALTSALKAELPGARMHNSCNDTLPPPDPKGKNLGEDASLEALYLDMICPQIYCGYNETAAKYAIMRTRQWKNRLAELGADCQLHPYFLIRFGGAGIRNSPAMLHLQTIGAAAEGADGVCYYYPQEFNANDWGALAATTRILAKYEDFYAEGTRCDSLVALKGAPERTEKYLTWPNAANYVRNPDWHLTAHELNGKVLVTVLNLQKKKLDVRLEFPNAMFLSDDGGDFNAETGKLTVRGEKTAFLLFEKAE